MLAYEIDVPIRIDVKYHQKDLFDFFLNDITSKGPLMILSASDIMFICYDHVSFLINDSDKFNEQQYGIPKYVIVCNGRSKKLMCPSRAIATYAKNTIFLIT